MGNSYAFRNLDKRQWFEPSDLGENDKRPDLGASPRVLALLLLYGPLGGPSWGGDRIEVCHEGTDQDFMMDFDGARAGWTNIGDDVRRLAREWRIDAAEDR